MPPKILVRVGREFGAVFLRPEDVAVDPVLQAAAEARAEAERACKTDKLAKVYDVAAKQMAFGPVTGNKLRKPLREAGISGNNEGMDALVDEAIATGTLVVPADGKDAKGRVIKMDGRAHRNRIRQPPPSG
jgi:hypothetical protein